MAAMRNLLPILEPLKSDRLVAYRYEPRGGFHMAHSKNLAARLGILNGADVLVNVDADNFTGPGFEDFIEDGITRGQAFLRGAKNSRSPAGTGACGRIAITRDAFLKTGGYDERFEMWGPDDDDFSSRLQLVGYRLETIPQQYLRAIQHGDDLRFKEYPRAQGDRWREWQEANKRPQSGVRNFGNVGVGAVRRTDGSWTVVKKIATRIFGIGLHKTATSSLHAALKILGFESGHWDSDAWASAVWDEMRQLGASPTMEQRYAISDLPIPMLYKELDKAYPGSKFILTLREEFDWLRSASNHFSDRNPSRWEWEVYPFAHKIHQELYQRRDFDATTFLSRYRRHNAEVLEYFKGRPNDLLVMRVPRWNELCGFLGTPVPTTDYPREFVTPKSMDDLVPGQATL